LESKINLKTINFTEFDQCTLNKLILALIDWVGKYANGQNEILTYKAIFISKEALKFTSDLIIKNLKMNNIINLISVIINANLTPNISNVCQEFIKTFVQKENELGYHKNEPNIMNNINNSNFNKNENLSNNSNIIKNDDYLNNDNTDYPSKVSSKIKYNNFHNDSDTQEKEQNFTFNNQTMNYPYNNLNTVNNNRNCDSNHNIINTNSINQTNFNNRNSNNKNRNNMTNNFNCNNNDKNFQNKTNNQIVKKDFYNSNSNPDTMIRTNINIEGQAENYLIGTSTFPLINISKEEEQIIYDCNINLKFGDSIHINKSLNYLFFYILNEFPIEYLLQNSEIIKSLLILIEKSNIFDYGNILFRIVNKIFYLIEKKIHLFYYYLSTKTVPLNKSNFNNDRDNSDNLIFYPEFPEINLSNEDNLDKFKNKKESKVNLEYSLSVRDFLIICAEALIVSSYNSEKLCYSVVLLEKNFSFLKKLMIDGNDDEWSIIIQNLITKIFDVIEAYKNKRINFELLSVLLFRFVLSFSDSAFIKFSMNTNFEFLKIIKDVLFIYDETQSNLGKEILNKMKRIINSSTSTNNNINNNRNAIIINNLNEIIIEYEKAEIINVSIDIAKRVNKMASTSNDYYKNNFILFFSNEDVKFILNNFNNLLLAYNYFIEVNHQPFINNIINKINKYQEEIECDHLNKNNNTENFNKIDDINEFSFVKFLSFCNAKLNSKEYYLDHVYKDLDNIKELELSNEIISQCFLKLFSIINTLDMNSPIKCLIYMELLSELKASDNLILLFKYSDKILLRILNDLASSVNDKNYKLEKNILEIIQEIFYKNIVNEENNYLNSNNNNHIQNKKYNDYCNFYFLFEILPIYPKSLKMLSLNTRIEKQYVPLTTKILKYLRLLFSTNELIRLNAINYFKNIFNYNTSENLNLLEDKIIEYVEFTNNYDKLKKLDLIYSFQTAEKEYENAFNNIMGNFQNIQIEFYPLLNILYSNKMDYNMKSSATEQLIFLTIDKKFSLNFCNEIIYFCFDILINKFKDYKNSFENKIVYAKNINVNNNDNNKFIENYNNFNLFLDEFYREANLNYISSLMKLINIIILNNSENNSIKDFLSMKKNEKLFEFLQGIIFVLFPSDFVEEALVEDFKKPKSKHILNVNLVYFLYLVAFNLKNSYTKLSSHIKFNEFDSCVDNKNFENFFINTKKNNPYNDKYIEIKQKLLTENYSGLYLHKQFYFNLIPIKNYIGFFSEESKNNNNEEHNLNNEDFNNYKINRNIIEFIKFKNFYSLKNNCHNSNNNHTIYDKEQNLLQNIYDERSLKHNINYLLNENTQKNNYLDIYINILNLFSFYISNNFKNIFRYIKIKNNENVKNSINKEITNFENNEAKQLVEILSFLKCTLPQTSEEKNIIIDIINTIKIYLIFYKDFLNLKNPNKNNDKKNIKVNIINYQKELNDIEGLNEDVFLPLLKKGLCDCIYNYFAFISNNKNFIVEFLKNDENQIFLIEILDLVIINEEIFNRDFFEVNKKAIVFIIKNFININNNRDLLITVRLLVTKLAINLYIFAGIDIINKKDEKNNLIKNVKNSNFNLNNNNNYLNMFILEHKDFTNIIFDSIEFFISNFKLSKLKKIQNIKFNSKHNFDNYPESQLVNLASYYPFDHGALEFKEICLLKNNFILLNKIIEFFNGFINKIDINSNESSFIYFSKEIQMKIANKSFSFFKYFEYNSFNPNEAENNNNTLIDNILFTDILILILDIIDKIKINEGRIQMLKTNPMIWGNLFDFITNYSAPTILVVAIVNFMNCSLEWLFKNNGNLKADSTEFRYAYNKNNNLINVNNDQIEENWNASENLDNFNPINEYDVYKSINGNINDLNTENLFEEIIILNEKIYDVNSLLSILNIIRKNLKSNILCFAYISLLKNLIKLSKFRNEASNVNQDDDYNQSTNLYDFICNSSYFEIQNEILKFIFEDLQRIINIDNEDFLNSFIGINYNQVRNIQITSNSNYYNIHSNFYNKIYYDKLISKINKLNEISQSLILIANSIELICIVFAKAGNFNNIYANYKIIIIENLNNLFNIMSILTILKSKINKKDFIIFFEVNGFSNIIQDIVNKFFSLFHLMYFKEDQIVNEDFLQITLSITEFNNKNNYKLKSNYKISEKDLEENPLYENKTENNIEENIFSNFKINKFVQVCYDLLVLEENNNLDAKISFAKILPHLIETIIFFNKKAKEANIIQENFEINKNRNLNNNYSNYDLNLKNEGDTILQLMTGLKEVYKIKYENLDLKYKYKFNFENNKLTEKNNLIYAISSLLLVSQTAKKLFVKSNFISTIIDYVKQLSDKLLDLNLENTEINTNKINKSKISNYITKNTNISSIRNNISSNINKDNINFIEEKNIIDNINVEYIISEYNNILILLQNFFCNFNDCEEKNSLFLPIEIINQNFISNNFTNVSNLNTTQKNYDSNNNSILSKNSFNNNLQSNNYVNRSISQNKISNSKTNKKNSYLPDINKNNTFNNVTNDLISLNKCENSLAVNFLKTFYDIFYDTIRFEKVHENYLKLLINMISKNDHAKKSFIISVSNPESVGNRDSFILFLLDYFQKKFLKTNLNNNNIIPSSEGKIPTLEYFIKFLKCLFQNKQIVLFLFKIRFIENFQKDLLLLLSNKKYYMNKANQVCLTYLLDLLISLTFDSEISKKIANKELIDIFTDSLIKIKNENIVYNIIFVFRNLSFINQNRAHFISNENLLGTIFTVISGEFSIKIKFIISHLIWILLFNNQTVFIIFKQNFFIFFL